MSLARSRQAGIVEALAAPRPHEQPCPLNHLITRFQEQTPIRASS